LPMCDGWEAWEAHPAMIPADVVQVRTFERRIAEKTGEDLQIGKSATTALP
jgi:hypothetical protein